MPTIPAPGEPDHPTVADLGEFGLIERVAGKRGQPASTLLGPGDDAAVVAAPDGRVVAGTDVLVQGVHFRLDWSTPEQVGNKAAAANLADIAAMGAVPTALLAGLACPADTPAATAEGLAVGLWAQARAVGVGVVGGDVTSGPVIVLSVTALGDLQGRPPVTRGGASAGEVVALCGRLGWAAAGLAVLSRGFRSPIALVNAHRVPVPPLAAGPQAAVAGATAMIDVSDGLLADLGHVARASDVSIDVATGALELPPRMVEVAGAMGADPLRWVLTGGEDHALVATFATGSAVPAGWRMIGKVLAAGPDGPGVLVDGRAFGDPSGWEHFSREAGG